MDRASEDEESFRYHSTRSKHAGKLHPQSGPQSIEKGREEVYVGLNSNSDHDFIDYKKCNSSRGERDPPSPGTDHIIKQPRLTRLEKHVTFYRLHVTYFLTLGSFGTLGMYVLPLSDKTQLTRLSFVDAMYTAFSALCGTGLQTVRSQDLTRSHNIFILLLMILGAPVLVSLFPVYVRRFYFHLCIRQLRRDSSTHQGNPSPLAQDVELQHKIDGKLVEQGPHEMELLHLDQEEPPDSEKTRSMKVDCPVVDIHADHPGSQTAHVAGKHENSKIFMDTTQTLKTLEYRALVALSWLVIFFFLGGQIIGFLLGTFYFFLFPSEATITRKMNINPTFYAFFTAISTFTNGGYNANNDGMLAFQKSTFLLILYTILASLGNTLYAPILRLLVWICYRLVGENDKDVYEYLLRHPRRCFTNLFPRSQTIWLVVTFVAFTSLQLLFLCILEWNQALGGMTPFEKLIVGVYQTVGTRNAGGNAVSLYALAPAILFILVVMMYISVYPNFLSLQTSKDAYDDSELPMSDAYEEMNPNKWGSIVVVQSRRLLARDTSYLFFSILFLLLSETSSIKRDPLNFSIFNIVFEVISTYGSVGLSLGYHCDLRIDTTSPCEKVPYSFSGTWTSTGKLILVVIMFLGRHRGLPDNIDSAIQLPTKPTSPKLPQTSRMQRSSPGFRSSSSIFLESHPGFQRTLSVTSILDFCRHRFTLLNVISFLWIKAQE